jgi:hypothetical protein
MRCAAGVELGGDGVESGGDERERRSGVQLATRAAAELRARRACAI